MYIERDREMPELVYRMQLIVTVDRPSSIQAAASAGGKVGWMNIGVSEGHTLSPLPTESEAIQASNFCWMAEDNLLTFLDDWDW
jgi:hypothetical protein